MSNATRTFRLPPLLRGWFVSTALFLGIALAAYAAPVAPTGLRGAVTGSGSLVLIWDDNSTDETHFEIAYTVNGGALQFIPLSSSTTAGTGTISAGPFGIADGVAYTFSIRAYTTSNANASAYTNTIAVNSGDFNAPTSPGVVVRADGSMLVFWTDSAYAEAGYVVEAATAPGGPFTAAGNTGANFTGFILGGLAPEATYYFRVRGFKGTATNPTATTANTSVVSATTPALAAPTGLVVTPISDAAVNFTFADNSTGNTGYEIEFRLSGTGGFSSLGEVVDTTSANSSNTLAPGTAYDFRVRAYYQNGANQRAYSGYSNIASATTPFTAPTALTATPTSETAINLTFADNSTGNTGYEIEYRLSGGGAFSLLGETGDVTSVNTGSTLASGTAYDFQVRAYYQNGTNPRVYSGYSNIASATTPFNAPTNLVVTPSPTTPYLISFSWTDNSSAETGYELEYRKQGAGSFVSRKVVAANTTSIANLPEFDPGTVYEFRIRARQGNGGSAYFPSVNGVTATTRDGFSSKPYAPIQVGTPFAYQLATISQSSRTSWSVGTLPPGLTFDNGTGAISGTPTTSGVYTVPMTATFSSGPAHTLNLVLRVILPAAAPQITAAIGAQTLTQGNAASIALDTKFADPDTGSAVRMATTKGNLDIVFYASATPQTVANFLNYNYTDVLFHRAPSGFVMQGGGFKTYAAPDVFEHIATLAAVPNEPGISNTYGTIAMAKVADDPNSATSEFFVNLGNNSANLDNQNGGFTVFGRVATPSLSTTLPALAAVPTANYAVQQYLGPSNVVATTLSDLPIDQLPPPGAVDQSKLLKVTSVTTLPVLTYAVSGNSNPSAVTASVVGNNLQLTGLAPGLASVTVTATDVDGNATPSTFTVEVQQTLAQWAASKGVPSGQSGANDDPDHDTRSNLHEWAFFTNPNAADATLGQPTFALMPPSGTRYLQLTFPVRKFAANLTYTVEASPTALPSSWTTVWTSSQGFTVPAVTSAVDQADRTIVTVRDTIPASPSAPKRFLRVTVQ